MGDDQRPRLGQFGKVPNLGLPVRSQGHDGDYTCFERCQVRDYQFSNVGHVQYQSVVNS
jgi:hypothetical protein